MQLQLTGEWVILIIVVLVVLLCGPLLCATPRRSRVVVPEPEKPESKGPAAPKTPRTQRPPPPPPAAPPANPPADQPDGYPPPDPTDLPPLVIWLEWIPPRQEPMDSPPGPWDAVPKAPNPAPDVSRRSSTHSTSTKCATSDVFSCSSSSAHRSSSTSSSSQGNWHQDIGRQPIDMTQSRPNFSGPVRFHAAEPRYIPVVQPRSCFALGPTLQPQLPLHTGSAQGLQTQSSTALKQRIPVMCQTLQAELVPQPLVNRKGQCDLESLQALLHTLPRCQSVCPPPIQVDRPTTTVQPQELQPFLQRPAAPPDTPGPALWQPQVRLTLPQQKPVGTERAMRAMQTLEFLPKPPEMLQRWCRKPAPHSPPAEPRPPCPVSGARPRPLKATDLLPISMPTLKRKQPPAGDAADLDPVTNMAITVIVQPGPLIWRSQMKEPSWCTSVQLRKPETPEWPINGSPRGPKRPETQPGLTTPATPEGVADCEPKEWPEESKEDLVAEERQKTPAAPKATPKPKPKLQRGARAPTRDATKETESSKTRSASGKTHDKSGRLDSTLGGPRHSWGRSRTGRVEAEEEATPGPGHYSAKHAGVHGRRSH